MKIENFYYWLSIAAGVCLLFIGAACVIKIYRGSKITFAYTMTAFTCAYGITFVGRDVLQLNLESGVDMLMKHSSSYTTGYNCKVGSLQFSTWNHQ